MKTGDWRRVLSGLEVLNSAAICCTEQRMYASQVAVLTSICLHPGCTSGVIIGKTGLSRTNVGKLLHELRRMGEVHFTKAFDREYKTQPKRWFLTYQGDRTVRRLLAGMRWTGMGRFVIVEVAKANKWEL